MPGTNNSMRRRWLFLSLLAGAGVVTAAFWFGPAGSSSVSSPTPAHAAPETSQQNRELRVETISPQTGGVDRVTVQPGTVHSFDWADLFSKVSGYLHEQKYDIGDKVKAGEVIAVIEAPELKEEVTRCTATVTQAKARVDQMIARVDTAKAEKEAAKAAIAEAQADQQRAEATLSYQGKQYQRMQDLFRRKAVDEKLVDETEDQYLAAKAAVEAAKAHVITQQAQVTAATAKIAQADADLGEARAQVGVANAELAHAQVMYDYTNIRSPYDGVVTQRNYHVGHFIRTGDDTSHGPLYTISRNDRMRVIVEVPDREVYFANPGDTAVVEVDALTGKKFQGKISRIAMAEDTNSRTERIEIDLANPTDPTHPEGILKHGMYGAVAITLEAGNKDSVRIPSSCLIGDAKDGEGTVYVVRNGRAEKRQIRLGKDNGIVVEVLDGLNANDQVVAKNNSAVEDGTPVQVVALTSAR